MARKRPAGDAVAGQRSIARVIVSGTSWNNLTSIVPIAINIVLTPYVIHGFGLTRWGLFVLVSSMSSFLGPLDGGLAGAANRFFAVYAGRDDRIKTTETLLSMLLVVTVLGVVTTLVGWFLAPVVIGLFHPRGELRGEGVFLLRTLGILVTFSFFHNLFAAVINARQRYALTNLTGTATYAVWTVGLVVCVHWRLGLRGAAVVFISQQVLAAMLIVPASLRYLSRDGVRLLPWSGVKELVRFSFSVQAMSVVALVNGEVDTLLIGGAFSLRTLAFYNSGSNFATQMRGLTYNVLSPSGTHLAQTFGRAGRAETEREFKRLQRLWVIATTGWCAVGLAACYFGIVAWLGPQFKLAGQVAVIMMLGNTINLYTGMLSSFLSAVGRPDLEVRYALLATVINVALTIPLIFVGPLGVVSATVVGSIVASVYYIRLVRKRYWLELPNFLRDVPLVPAAIAGGVTLVLEDAMRGLSPSGPAGLLFCAVPALVGLGVFGLVVFLPHIRVPLGMLRRRHLSVGPLVRVLLNE